MATTTTIMWTALPNGGTNRAFRLSIYVSPRLEGSGATGTLTDASALGDGVGLAGRALGGYGR